MHALDPHPRPMLLGLAAALLAALAILLAFGPTTTGLDISSDHVSAVSAGTAPPAIPGRPAWVANPLAPPLASLG